MARGRDRIIGGVVITTSNNIIRFREDATTYTITIPAGTYWLYTGTDLDSAHPSLYDVIVTEINGTVGIANTYAAEGIPPKDWTRGDLYAGLRLHRIAGTDTFAWRFDDGAWTFPPEYLGYASDRSTIAVDTGNHLDSPYAIRGAWVSPEAARDWRSFQRGRVEVPTEDTALDNLYAMHWGTRRYRLMVYRHTLGAYVHKNRGLDDEAAEVAGIAIGDDNVGLEHVWEWLRDFNDIIILHNSGNESDHMDIAGNYSDSWETLRLASVETARDFERVARLENLGGEYYRLELPLVRIGGTYEQ